MSNYTIMLRHIIENGVKDIGLNDYPIYDESHREELNQKIINHFFFREIGFETFGVFKFKLRAKMHEIMPYYNELYKTLDIDYDMLSTHDLTETMEREVIGNDNQTSEQKQLVNETPMGKLNDPFSTEYASEAQQGENTTKTNQNSKETYQRTTKGKSDSRSYSELVED